ncbi:MAG TPA: hypothetical protein VL134_07415 [Leptolyngbya sp.]|jgi:hypothetical protein|nr:hypothetical protein [Leptolyngbya sp.]
MTLNSRPRAGAPKAALNFFLPLSILSIALVAGELKANAQEPSTVKATTATTVTTKGAALLGQPSIDINRKAVIQEFSTDSRFTVAQATPSTIDPARAVPGSAPSGAPTNPAEVSPDSATPSTPAIEQTTPVTPSTAPVVVPTTPATPGVTPVTPTTPSTITPTTPETTPVTPETTTPETTTPTTPSTTPETTPGTPVSPFQGLDPGRATRSGSSYVGIGGNIGLGDGDIPLGQGSFALISKIGLTRNFSVRPSILFNDDVAILLPVTYDFSSNNPVTGGLGFRAAPYVGLGAAISTGRGGDVGLLLTGGVDVPLSSQFTATAAVNASVTGQAAVGILVGVGYNFAGF